MDLFIFGTLLHVPLLEVVSGVDGIARHLSPAQCKGYSVSRVAGQVFPMIHPDAGGAAQGVIVSGLDDDALARLDYYEKVFGFDRTTFQVTEPDGTERDVTAYVPEPNGWDPAEPWDRDAWINVAGARTTLAAGEVMGLMGRHRAEDVGQWYGGMMSRATSYLRAIDEPKGAGFGQEDVALTQIKTPYTGFFSVKEADLTFRRFDGSMSQPVNRGVFMGVDCAIVLPYDPVRDRVLLVEQFRPGAYLRGDPNPWTLEPIAGRIDPGETPQDAARREGMEEAGVAFYDLQSVSAAYPSPGTTTEHFFLYIGLCDLPDGSAGIGGEEHEAEDIRSHLMDWAEFDQALNGGAYRLVPLLATGHWLGRHRERLRAFG